MRFVKRARTHTHTCEQYGVLLCEQKQLRLWHSHMQGLEIFRTLANVDSLCTFLCLLVIYSCLTRRRSRSRWPRGLRCGSAAARLLGLRVRIPPRAWLFLSYEFYVLSGRGLCGWPIPRPEEPYRAWSTATVIFCTYNEDTEMVRLNTFYGASLASAQIQTLWCLVSNEWETMWKETVVD